MGAFPAFQIAPPLPFIPEDRHGDTFIAIVACWAGPLEEGEEAIKPFHDVAPVVAEFVGPDAVPGAQQRVRRPGSAGPAALLEGQLRQGAHRRGHRGARRARPRGARPSTRRCTSTRSTGRRTAWRPDATAFAYRDANFATVIAGMWPEPAQNEANIEWVRDYYDAIAPHSEEGGYVNFMADDDQGRIRANYKGNYERLVEVKRRVRPGQPVPPQPEHRAVTPNDAPC